jgi:queuosine biosynthesis protein QueC
VLFSGGQDSSVCLAWALERYARVETVGFDYGQRHVIEMQARQSVRRQVAERFPHWAQRLGEDHVLDLTGFGAVAQSALTADVAIEMTERGLPSTFVPGRNLVFLIYAAALADRRGLGALVGGMCETDFSGYPDCRRDTLDAMQSRPEPGHGPRLRRRDPADEADQGRDLGPGQDPGRRGPGRPDRGREPHLLPGRPRRTARLGPRLRRMPGLRAAAARV